MYKHILPLRWLTFLAAILLNLSSTNAQLPSPREHFGFTPGDDRMMFTYESMMQYMQKLADASPMVHIEPCGTSELGRPMYNIFISSAENIARLERLREINQMLALDEIPEGTSREELIREGRVFFLSTLSMHANEVGPVQALPLIAWELLTGSDPRRETILQNTVAMFLPHNPDGMNMIVEHYNKYKDTPLETSNMPGVYHKYIGHNINRDFITLTMSENRAVAETYSTRWFPQAMVERHQMGSYGPRFYISPPHDPIAENVDAGIWNWMRVYGSRTLTEMTDAGLASVSVNYLFDDYWPGATTTSIWKGVIGMLSEAASVHLATPIYVEPNELRTIGKGLGEYAISINLPKPWEGGWWRLSDIVRYEMENTFSYLHTSALHRAEILQFRNELTRREIRRGQQEAPFYYIMPLQQHDASEMVAMVNLLHLHGIKTYQLTEDIAWNHRNFKAGDLVVPLAQPYRAFIKEIMEKQTFPARHYTPGGELIRPYDITSWSLPLHRGVEAVEITTAIAGLEQKYQPVTLPFTLRSEDPPHSGWAIFTAAANESFKAAFKALELGIRVERSREAFRHQGMDYPAGTFIIPVGRNFGPLNQILSISPAFSTEKPQAEVYPLRMPRIALVETWIHDMDGGWTRFIFDQYHIPYTVVRPHELQTLNLQRQFDILIFTDRDKSVYMHGKFEREGRPVPLNYPPDYTKGMEKKGFDRLMQYINNGGRVMAWGPSTALFLGTLSIGEKENTEEFVLPVNDIGKELATRGLYVPGSLLRVNLRTDHPLTWGMPAQIGVFHRGTPVFRTSIPHGDMDRRVIATFASENILMSGYAEKEELLRREPALVWVQKGNGQIILSSFNPQFRSSTAVSYKLLFNALLME